MPPSRKDWPKVKRVSPPMTATPIIDNVRPKAPPISPFSTLPLERLAISVRPRIASQKYSVDWKASATCASGGASVKSRMTPTSPPKTLASVARVMARSPSPRRAIG